MSHFMCLATARVTSACSRLHVSHVQSRSCDVRALRLASSCAFSAQSRSDRARVARAPHAPRSAPVHRRSLERCAFCCSDSLASECRLQSDARRGVVATRSVAQRGCRRLVVDAQLLVAPGARSVLAAGRGGDPPQRIPLASSPTMDHLRESSRRRRTREISTSTC